LTSSTTNVDLSSLPKDQRYSDLVMSKLLFKALIALLNLVSLLLSEECTDSLGFTGENTV